MNDITSLEQILSSDSTSSTVTTDITSTLTQIVAWIVIPSAILTLVVVVLLIIYALRKRKVENAILEIRDILRDMQQSQTPVLSTPLPAQPVSNAAPQTDAVL